MTLQISPWPHQEAGARWLAGRGRAILADEQGMGKTDVLVKTVRGRISAWISAVPPAERPSPSGTSTPTRVVMEAGRLAVESAIARTCDSGVVSATSLRRGLVGGSALVAVRRRTRRSSIPIPRRRTGSPPGASGARGTPASALGTGLGWTTTRRCSRSRGASARYVGNPPSRLDGSDGWRSITTTRVGEYGGSCAPRVTYGSPRSRIRYG